MPETKDEALVQEFRNGDDSALATLINRYQKRVWACAFKNSNYRDKSFIDDITQIVFYTVFRLIKSGNFIPRYPGSFQAWLFNIARKVALTENRRYGHTEPGLDKEYLETFTDLSSADLKVRMPEESTDTTKRETRLNLINEAVAKLDPLDRKLFELRKKGYSYEQILREPDFKENNSGQLKMRYSRILEFIRRDIYGT